MHACICMCICMFIHVCIYSYTHAHTHTHTHTRAQQFNSRDLMHVLETCMYVCVCMFMCVCICIFKIEMHACAEVEPVQLWSRLRASTFVCIRIYQACMHIYAALNHKSMYIHINVCEVHMRLTCISVQSWSPSSTKGDPRMHARSAHGQPTRIKFNKCFPHHHFNFLALVYKLNI